MSHQRWQVFVWHFVGVTYSEWRLMALDYTVSFTLKVVVRKANQDCCVYIRLMSCERRFKRIMYGLIYFTHLIIYTAFPWFCVGCLVCACHILFKQAIIELIALKKTFVLHFSVLYFSQAPRFWHRPCHHIFCFEPISNGIWTESVS